jgi:ABC-type multidrug transport system permease subunit
MLSNILVELPWATLGAVILFFCWYYPIGLYRNASYTNAVASRGVLEFLFVWEFLLFSSTFAHLMIAGIETAESAGNLANVLFSLCLLFNGVLVGPDAMPGFWIFMYRVSPFTYLVEGLLANGVAHAPVTCAANEYQVFDAPSGSTCGEYVAEYLQAAGGYLVDPNATEQCQLCAIDNTDSFLSLVSIHFSNRWRDFGILFVFIIFNIFAATGIYYLARVPKGKKYAGKDKDKDGKKDLVKTETKTEKEDSHSSQGNNEDAVPEGVLGSEKDNRSQVGRYEPIKASKTPEKESGTNIVDAVPSRPEPERFVTAPEFGFGKATS